MIPLSHAQMMLEMLKVSRFSLKTLSFSIIWQLAGKGYLNIVLKFTIFCLNFVNYHNLLSLISLP